MSAKVEIIFKAKDMTVSAVKSLRAGLGKVEGKILSLKGAVAAYGVGKLASSFVEAASTSENLKIRLGALLGSVDQGNKLFNSMSKYASGVSFSYEEVMQSATNLAGIMKGGVKEVEQWMPLIGDLAAASGESIQSTTEQVQRMLSGGAAAADKFRDKGILAMLGFQSGVHYSTEETKNMLIKAWEDQNSKFAGTAAEQAATWDGTMSMLGDKWFQFRNKVMDNGVFDFLKSLAAGFDKYVGDSMDDSVDAAGDWANNIVYGISIVIKAVGYMANAFVAIKMVWKLLKDLFWQFISYITEKLNTVTHGLNAFIDLWNEINETNVTHVGTFDAFQKESETAFLAAEKDLTDYALKATLPSDAINKLTDAAVAHYEKTAAARKKAEASTKGNKAAEFQQGAAKNAINPSGPEQSHAEEIKAIKDNALERYAVISDSLATETARVQNEYNERMGYLEANLALRNITQEQYDSDRNALAAQYDQEMTEAKRAEADKQNQIQYDAGMFGVITAQTMGDQLMNLAEQNNADLFKMTKNLALSMARTALKSAVMTTFQRFGGWPTGVAPAAIMAALGSKLINAISGTTYQAHAGITKVPTGPFTANLQAGERVLTGGQNKDLTDFLSSPMRDSGASVNVQTVNIDLRFDNINALRSVPDIEMRKLVRDKIIPALDVLSKQGHRMKDIERIGSI